MTNVTRKINKILNWFWGLILLAPIITWILSGAVAFFQGTQAELISLGAVIELFIGIVPTVSWLDSIWTALFAVNGVLPFTSSPAITLPIVNYIIFWSVARLFVSVFIWLPCWCSKLIERWFE